MEVSEVGIYGDILGRPVQTAVVAEEQFVAVLCLERQRVIDTDEGDDLLVAVAHGDLDGAAVLDGDAAEHGTQRVVALIPAHNVGAVGLDACHGAELQRHGVA